MYVYIHKPLNESNLTTAAGITFTESYIIIDNKDVYAGVAPLNASLLNNGKVPVYVLDVFEDSWISSMDHATRYTTSVDAHNCSGKDCSALYLPGSVEAIRLFRRNLNETLLGGNVLKEGDVIITHQAPGYQVEFSPLNPEYSFNESSDCTLYGQHSGEGVYVCFGRDGDALTLGKFS
jgi:hypothetical protein